MYQLSIGAKFTILRLFASLKFAFSKRLSRNRTPNFDLESTRQMQRVPGPLVAAVSLVKLAEQSDDQNFRVFPSSNFFSSCESPVFSLALIISSLPEWSGRAVSQ